MDNETPKATGVHVDDNGNVTIVAPTAFVYASALLDGQEPQTISDIEDQN